MAARTAEIRLLLDASGAVRGVHAVGGSFVELKTETESTGKSVGDLGRIFDVALGSLASRAVEALGQRLKNLPLDAIKAATTFQAEFSKIEALVGVTGETLEELRQGALDLAPAVGRGPNELAQALFVITSAGQRGTGALEILEQAAKASAIGLGETESISRAVTSALNAYGVENLNAARATQILAGTVREGNLEAASLAPVLGRVFALSSQLGVSFEEVGANIATFTRLGGDASEAVTSLRGVLSALINPTEGAREALKNAGISVDELQESLRTEGLAQTLLLLTDRFKGNTAGLQEVIPNIRALTNVLANAGVQGDVYAQILASINDNTADIIESGFEGAIQTTQFQLKRFNADVERTQVLLATAFLPAINAALESVRPLLESLAGLSDEFEQIAELLEPAVIPAMRALGDVIGDTTAATSELLGFTLDLLELYARLDQRLRDLTGARYPDWIREQISLTDLWGKSLKTTLSLGLIPLVEFISELTGLAEQVELITDGVEGFQESVDLESLAPDLAASIDTFERLRDAVTTTKDETKKLKDEGTKLFEQLAKPPTGPSPFGGRVSEIAARQERLQGALDAAQDRLDQRQQRYRDRLAEQILATQQGAQAEVDAASKIEEAEERKAQARARSQQQQAAANAQAILSAENTTEALLNVLRREIVGHLAALLARAIAPLGPAALFVGPVLAAAIGALWNRVIPSFAGGVTDFPGGLALVGERGPELVTLGQGSNVLTNENTTAVLNALSGAGNSGAVVAELKALRRQMAALRFEVDRGGLRGAFTEGQSIEKALGISSR